MTRRAIRWTTAAALSTGLVALAAGCGAAATDAPNTPRSDRLVDFGKKPPYVNALDLDPRSGDLLLTTNRGFFRVTPRSKTVRRIRGSISAEGKRATVGTFLEILATGPGQFVGSGHPDKPGTLPAFLGLIRSADGGRTWSVVSRLGDADLHKIVLAHDRLYAFDAVLSALIISSDGGRTFTENFTPRGLVIDFVVDPADPEHVLAANADELFRSRDMGASWRPLDRRAGTRLAWPAADALYRAQQDGTVERSKDGGDSWDKAARVDGEPYKFRAVGPDELYLALSDGTVLHTTDGAQSWEAVFRP
jgi:hypothetical protein